MRTDSTAWATQLKLLTPTVLRRLNEDLGDGTVTILEVLGPHGPSWKKGRLLEPGRTRPARHLRLSDGRREAARADLRASARYGESPDPLFVRPTGLPRPLRARFCPQIPPSVGGGAWNAAF